MRWTSSVSEHVFFNIVFTTLAFNSLDAKVQQRLQDARDQAKQREAGAARVLKDSPLFASVSGATPESHKVSGFLDLLSQYHVSGGVFDKLHKNTKTVKTGGYVVFRNDDDGLTLDVLKQVKAGVEQNVYIKAKEKALVEIRSGQVTLPSEILDNPYDVIKGILFCKQTGQEFPLEKMELSLLNDPVFVSLISYDYPTIIDYVSDDVKQEIYGLIIERVKASPYIEIAEPIKNDPNFALKLLEAKPHADTYTTLPTELQQNPVIFLTALRICEGNFLDKLRDENIGRMISGVFEAFANSGKAMGTDAISLPKFAEEKLRELSLETEPHGLELRKKAIQLIDKIDKERNPKGAIATMLGI